MGGNVTVDSASEVIRGTGVNCKGDGYLGLSTCTDELGGVLLFSANTMSGAISVLFGSIGSPGDKYRDSVYVESFRCSKI
jgi:hypothetical protein